jgi:hypothetical protein
MENEYLMPGCKPLVLKFFSDATLTGASGSRCPIVMTVANLQQMINKCKKKVAPKIDRSPPPKSLERSISSNSDTYPASSSSDTASLKGNKKHTKRKRDQGVKLIEHPNSLSDHPITRINKPEEEARLAKRRKGLVTTATAKAAIKSAAKK